MQKITNLKYLLMMENVELYNKRSIDSCKLYFLRHIQETRIHLRLLSDIHHKFSGLIS